jgi:hypothetical protein
VRSGEGGSVDDRTVTEVIRGLRALVEAIDEGRIEATDAQRAYLAGAVDTLVAVSERGFANV